MARSKKIIVLGGGISGYGAAILAKKQGFETLLSDAGTLAPKYRELLDKWSVEYEEGGHTLERMLDATEVIKSPGIPDTAPVVATLRERGIPIISEIEFAARYMGSARTICITGSNGKTTTTSLIYKIMRDSGARVALGGNIGESVAYSVATEEYDWYVLELSSFQLDGTRRFRPDIAVLMNITPDHLDRYDYCFQNYVNSKMSITRNQTSRDWFIYSADDQTIASELAQRDIRARELPFMAHSGVASSAGDAYMDSDDHFVARVGDSSVDIECARLQIKGPHNCYNAMAAALATLAAGVAPQAIAQAIYDFSPVEHRLEPAGSWHGINFINDSKATNVDSTLYALRAMTTPTVWIAGGTDKGNDYAPLLEVVTEHVHTLVCMGVDNRKLIEAFTGTIPNIISCSSLDQAMRAAVDSAAEGDTVLLSPACASFDLFRNYQDRGCQFKAWVAAQNQA